MNLRSRASAVILPAKGYAVSASGRPMAEWPLRAGEKQGWHWRVGFGTGGGRGKAALFDPNAWKTFVAERLLTAQGAAGCLQLFGDKAYTHQLFANHLTAEYAREESGRGRKVTVWKVKPGGPDNHWFDCLVGCAVAASISGLVWSGAAAAGGVVTDAKVEPSKPRMKFSEQQKLKRQGSAA